MFEPVEGNRGSGSVAKVFAFSAAGVLLSLGLCGAGMSFHNTSASAFLNGLGVLLFFASLIGIFVGFVMLIFSWFDR